MISATNLRSGTTFEDEGQIYQVLTYEHIKMGRGTATVKLKVKNIKTGTTTFKTFISNARVNEIELTKEQFQFLYRDKNTLHFMDAKTFNELAVPQEKLTGFQFLKEGQVYALSFWQGEAMTIALPPKMEFQVSETGPNVKGNSATNIFKDAFLENGLKVKVPLFIKVGDKIIVDTRSGEYHEKSS